MGKAEDVQSLSHELADVLNGWDHMEVYSAIITVLSFMFEQEKNPRSRFDDFVRVLSETSFGKAS